MAKTKYSLRTMSLMLIITVALALYASNMPDYFGDVKTMFFLLMLFSAMVTLRVAARVKPGNI